MTFLVSLLSVYNDLLKVQNYDKHSNETDKYMHCQGAAGGSPSPIGHLPEDRPSCDRTSVRKWGSGSGPVRETRLSTALGTTGQGHRAWGQAEARSGHWPPWVWAQTRGHGCAARLWICHGQALMPQLKAAPMVSPAHSLPTGHPGASLHSQQWHGTLPLATLAPRPKGQTSMGMCSGSLRMQTILTTATLFYKDLLGVLYGRGTVLILSTGMYLHHSPSVISSNPA